MAEQESNWVSFSPKQVFLKKRNEDQLAEYRLTMSDIKLKEAFRDALAEMAWRGASQEQISGARIFIDVALNMSEKETHSKPLPSKPLMS